MPVRGFFYLLVGAQVVFLSAWAGYHESALRSAPTVLLDTRPVDPREILRGDFITLNYVISSVPRSLVAPRLDPDAQHYGETLCVTLAPEGPFWALSAAALGRCACDEPLPGGQYRIEGMIVGGWGGSSDLQIDLGIGRYYVPEGKGTPQGKITARVAVTRHCRALLKEIYLDGRRYPS